MKPLTVMTLADGSEIDTAALPAGQRMCYACMHLHDEADIAACRS